MGGRSERACYDVDRRDAPRSSRVETTCRRSRIWRGAPRRSSAAPRPLLRTILVPPARRHGDVSPTRKRSKRSALAWANGDRDRLTRRSAGAHRDMRLERRGIERVPRASGSGEQRGERYSLDGTHRMEMALAEWTATREERLYFEPDGTLVDTIVERPVVVGSPEATAFKERHERQVRGLALTDNIQCSDGRRFPPN